MTKRQNMGMTLASFGKSLIDAATKNHDATRQKEVVDAITAQMRLRDDAEISILSATRQRDYYQETLDAIEKGQFSITIDKRIVFHDEDLRLGHWQPQSPYASR